MPIVTGIAKIYLNLDKTEKKVLDPFISRGSNLTVQIMLVGPFEIQNSQYVNFELENTVEVPTRYMTLVAIENSADTNNEDWGVWVYTIGEKILAGAASNGSSELNVSFTEFLNSTIESQYEFIGFQSTEAALNFNFPTPNDDEYVGVGDGTTLGTSACYLAVNSEWIAQGMTVLEFESANDILRESFVSESDKITLSVDPNISTINDEVDNTNLDVIFANMSTLNGKVLSIETLLGDDGENFVKSNINSEYTEISTPESDDQFYIYRINGDKRRVSFANIVEGARENFIGTFDTASGLVCPDPDDLICTYPNGIADPTTRLGWVATVLATNTKWPWSSTSNAWVDSGQAPSLASDVGYDPASDPSTAETNVQDAMVEHGEKIDQNDGEITNLKARTSNLNLSGNIDDDIEVLPGKDINSPDLDTGTGGTYTAIIQALIAEFTRQNGQDILIADNATNIAAKLVKDFSTLLNKDNPDNTDLLVLWDGATNKNISFAELVAKIEATIVNDQGYFATIAALKLAIPIGEPGWFATIGDYDYIGIWDVETADWVESAQTLHYSKTAGDALEIRVTTNENDIVILNAALVDKEDKSNKSSNVGDLGDPAKYPSWEGIENYVEPIRIINNEDRTHVEFLQLVGTTNFQTNLNDTSLFEGRILYGRINTITIQAGNVMISIDGGATFKNLAAFEPTSGLFFDFDLTVNNVFGRYITLIYYASIDKWIISHTNENLGRIVGSGWSTSVTLMGEKAVNDLQNIRLDNIEGGSLSGKSTIVQEVSPAVPITIGLLGTLTKLDFSIESIESNDRNIIDVDGNTDIMVKEDAEPGYRFTGNFKIENTGSVNSTSTVTFYLFESNQVIDIANALDTVTLSVTGTAEPFADRSKSIIGSNDFINALSGFPATFLVYYTNDTGNPTDIVQASLTVESLFTGIGVSITPNITVPEPLLESADGNKTDQQAVNKEVTLDIKDQRLQSTVLVANYQSVGQYMLDASDIKLVTRKVVRVLFSGFGTDLTELVELSLDNGSLYYDVEYRETDRDLTVKNAITHVMDLYFTGTKFIATYVDSAIDNQDLPYIGEVGQFEIPKSGVPVVIGEETASLVKNYKGLSLNNILKGNFSTVDGWIPTGGTGAVANNIYTLTGNGGSSTPTVFFTSRVLLDGYKECYYCKVMVTNSDCTKIRMRNYAGTLDVDIDNPVINTWYELFGIVTGSPGTEATPLKPIAIEQFYADAATANGKELKVDGSGKGVLGIPITNTPIESYTASVIVSMITKYFEGVESVKNINIETFGKNKFDKIGNVEIGDIDSATGLDSVNTGRNRTSLYTPIIAEQVYSINSGVWQGAFYYDSNFNPIDYGGATFYEVLAGSTFTPVAGAYYVRFRSLSILTDEQINTFQIEIGSVATGYEDFIKANALINEELRSVGTDIQDDFNEIKVKKYVLTEDDITLLFTTPSNVDTVTIVKQLDDVLYGNDDDFDANSPVFYDGYTVGTYSDSTDKIGIIYNLNTTSYSIIVANGTYADLAAAKTALAGTEIYYALDTPLKRDGIDAPLLDMDGTLITGPGYTYLQITTNGITNEFLATSAVNTKAQTKLNTDAAVDLFNENIELKAQITSILARLDILETP